MFLLKQMKTNGVDMLTLCFLDNSTLDLQERPIDCQRNNHVTLKVVEVTEHGRDDLPWYCQNGICRVGGGIPVWSLDRVTRRDINQSEESMFIMDANQERTFVLMTTPKLLFWLVMWHLLMSFCITLLYNVFLFVGWGRGNNVWGKKLFQVPVIFFVK